MTVSLKSLRSETIIAGLEAGIPDLPVDAEPDTGADWLVTYDTSAATLKKIPLGSTGGSGINAEVQAALDAINDGKLDKYGTFTGTTGQSPFVAAAIAASETAGTYFNTAVDPYERWMPLFEDEIWGWVALGTVDVVPDTRTLTAGTGLTGGGDLSADRSLALDLEYVQDQVAAMITEGTGITKSYNDGTGALTLSAAGGSSALISSSPAAAFGGSLFANLMWPVNLSPTAANAVGIVQERYMLYDYRHIASVSALAVLVTTLEAVNLVLAAYTVAANGGLGTRVGRAVISAGTVGVKTLTLDSAQTSPRLWCGVWVGGTTLQLRLGTAAGPLVPAVNTSNNMGAYVIRAEATEGNTFPSTPATSGFSLQSAVTNAPAIFGSI